MNKKCIIIAALLIGLASIPAIAADLPTATILDENLPQNDVLELEQTANAISDTSSSASSPQSVAGVVELSGLSKSGMPDIVLFEPVITSLRIPLCLQVEGTPCSGSCNPSVCVPTVDCPPVPCYCQENVCNCNYLQ